MCNSVLKHVQDAIRVRGREETIHPEREQQEGDDEEGIRKVSQNRKCKLRLEE